MSDNIARYDAYGNVMPKKSVPTMKQTEEKHKKKTEVVYIKIKQCASYAKNLGLDVHAGHGLTYRSAYQISKIEEISEFNIGHFIVAESIFIGLKNSIKQFKKIINK